MILAYLKPTKNCSLQFKKRHLQSYEKLPDIKGRDYLIRATHPLEDRFIGNAFMYDLDEKKKILKDPSIATRPQDKCKPYYSRVPEYDDVTKCSILTLICGW